MPTIFQIPNTNLSKLPVLKSTEISSQYMLWNQAEADVKTQKITFSHELNRFSTN